MSISQILLLGGIAGAIVVASSADSMVRRAAALLPPDVRERIWQREAGASLWWRVPEILGVILIVAGILKVFHVIKPPPALDIHGMAIMAVGLAVVCLANAGHAWLSSHYYRTEAPGTSASRSALAAALVVSLAELALAALICWFVFTHLPKTARKAAAPQEVQTLKREQPEQPQWLEEAEALKLLEGKDAAYLKALVRHGDIFVRDENGRQVYLRADILELKKAGLPAEEELKE